MRVAAATHRGHHREENQDRIVIEGVVLATGVSDTVAFEVDVPCLAAVVDGMGGHPGGGVAAAIVADVLASHLGELHGADDVIAMVRRANDAVYAAMARIPALAGMGATVAGAFVTEAEVIVFNVGDARVYLEGSGYLLQASVDDRAPGARHGPIIQSLGGLQNFSPVEVHVSVEPRASGRILMASDGLFADVAHDRLETACRGPLLRSVAGLQQTALDAGGRDNIAVAMIDPSDVDP